MNADDVRVLACDTVFQGYFRIDRYRLQHRRHDGGWTEELTREVFERGHAVGVLPYDPLRDEVVLIEQFRVGAHAAGWAPWQLEVVAGIIDEGETAEDVARRESLEEAGLTLLELAPIADFLVSQGAVSETVRLFCGRVDATGAGGIHGLAHEGEDIKVVVVPFAELTALLAENKVTNATGLIALQWLLLNRDALRARWSG
ncbi:MAG: NUDIX domain-containing protein [Kiloniellales bacterium]|nr:NUDIX domain-containing protein [Kiloniellales bacterium]